MTHAEILAAAGLTKTDLTGGTLAIYTLPTSTPRPSATIAP